MGTDATKGDAVTQRILLQFAWRTPWRSHHFNVSWISDGLGYSGMLAFSHGWIHAGIIVGPSIDRLGCVMRIGKERIDLIAPREVIFERVLAAVAALNPVAREIAWWEARHWVNAGVMPQMLRGAFV